jgi:hypothetical protein
LDFGLVYLFADIFAYFNVLHPFIRVLWKIFRPQSYSSDGNLRNVHLMELRTLKKMGFNFIVAINLTTWIERPESEKIAYLTEQLNTILLKPDF